MNDSNCVPMHRENPPQRDWSAIRGEVSIYCLVASVLALVWVAQQDISLRESEIAVSQRLIQRMDTDALITERALAALEGRNPSQQAQKHRLRTEQAD